MLDYYFVADLQDASIILSLSFVSLIHMAAHFLGGYGPNVLGLKGHGVRFDRTPRFDVPSLRKSALALALALALKLILRQNDTLMVSREGL